MDSSALYYYEFTLYDFQNMLNGSFKKKKASVRALGRGFAMQAWRSEFRSPEPMF